MKFKKNAICLGLSVSLMGCAISQKTAIDRNGADLDQRSAQQLAGVLPSAVPVVQRVHGAWLAPKSVTLGEDASLPVEFSNAKNWPLAVGWRDRADLRTIAERISKITGLPVRINPDVYETTPGMLPSASVATPKSDGLPPPPPRPGLSSSPSVTEATASTMEMNYSGSLGDFLNRAAMHFSVNWEYKNGAIQFYRYVTKMFQVNANSGDSQFNSTLGKTSGSTSQGSSGSSSGGGGSSGTTGSSFTSSGQVTMQANFSVWKSLKEELDAVKTPPGKITISQATGTIVMRDTRDAVDAAERILRHENRLMTLQVAIKIELYSITTSDARNLGINWNVVFTQLSKAFSLSLASPASIVLPGVGSLGAAILPPATSGSGPSYQQQLSGSQLLLQALEGVGRVDELDTAATVTLNRHLGTLASTDQLTYLASTTPGFSGLSGGGSGLPGLTPGTVTTGLIANALPTVLDDGSVMLTLSLDNSVLKSLGLISTGSGATLQQIQTPEVNGFSTIPQVALKPGSTLVLSGLAHDTAQYNQQTLTGQVGLGGSYSGTRQKVTNLILVTAQLLPGG